MTMMSRTSSESSFDEHDSNISPSIQPRKSLDQLLAEQEIPKNGRMLEQQDMPSLSSFRADEMSASIRTDCDVSLPSLSSFRVDDLSLSSSYHSTTNHYSDYGSTEGWSSFNSGNGSADTSESGEFASSSSSPAPPKSEREAPQRTDSLPMPKRTTSPTPPLKEVSSGRKKSSIIMLSPSRSRSPSIEANIQPIISIPKRPQRTTSPPRTVSPRQTAERPSNIGGPTLSGKDNTLLAPRVPVRRGDTSPIRKPVERTGSLPLTVLSRPPAARPGLEDSSSSLKGGDSLPRIPRRTSYGDGSEIGAAADSAVAQIENEEKSEEGNASNITVKGEIRNARPSADSNVKLSADSNVKKSADLPVDVKSCADPNVNSSTDPADTAKTDFKKRKSPTSVSSLEDAKQSSTESTVASSSEVETADEKEDTKDPEKRGGLKSLIRNSFRSNGKTLSFRGSFGGMQRTASFGNSFRIVGRTASQLKRMGRSKRDNAYPDSQEKKEMSSPRRSIATKEL